MKPELPPRDWRPATSENGAAPALISGWRRITAFVVVLALAAAMLAVGSFTGAGAAQAATISHNADFVQGSFTGGSTATAGLPNSLAPLGDVTITAPPGVTDLGGLPGGVRYDQPFPSCFTATSGPVVDCGSNMTMVTFPHPIVNPLIGFSTGPDYQGDATTCVGGWAAPTIAQVNGAAIPAGVVTFRGSTGPAGLQTFNPATNSIVTDPALVSSREGADCPGGAHGGIGGYFQISGLVTSVEISTDSMYQIVHNTNGEVIPPEAAPVLQIGYDPAFPNNDLSVTNTAAATTATNGTITWNLNVTNAAVTNASGGFAARGFILRDAIPASVLNPTLVSQPSGANCTLTDHLLECKEAPTNCTIAQNAAVPALADLSCASLLDTTAPTDSIRNIAPGASFGPVVLSGTAPAAVGATVTNSATVVGTAEDSDLTDNTQDATTTTIASPKLTLVKQVSVDGDPSQPLRAGETANYQFFVTNAGDIAVNNVAIDDTGFTGTGPLSAVTCPVTSLAPQASTTCTASYQVTQADVDAGTLSNTATVSGLPDGSTTPVTSGGSTATLPFQPKPGLSLVKSGALEKGEAGDVGDTIDYTFALTNTGNVTESNVAVTDKLAGLSGISYAWPDAANPGTLPPGSVATGSASYTITQADVDAGSVVNTATVSGTDPAGDSTTGGGGTTVPTDTAKPGLSLVKTGALKDGETGKVGDTVDFSFRVTNSGNVTETGVSVADQLPGLSALSYTWPGADGVLAPGQTATATAAYVLSQRDVDSGSVVNTATTTGTDPAGDPITGGDTATVPIESAPSLTLVKTGAFRAGQTGKLGDTIDYTITVTNTGNVTETGVIVRDPLSGLSGLAYAWPGTPGTLAPGEQVVATATYVITRANVDKGSVLNTATVTGTTPGGGQTLGNGHTTTTLPAPAAAAHLGGDLAYTGSNVTGPILAAMLLLLLGLGAFAGETIRKRKKE